MHVRHIRIAKILQVEMICTALTIDGTLQMMVSLTLLEKLVTNGVKMYVQKDIKVQVWEP